MAKHPQMYNQNSRQNSRNCYIAIYGFTHLHGHPFCSQSKQTSGTDADLVIFSAV